MKIRAAELTDIDAMTGLLRLLFEIEADFEFNPAKHQLAFNDIINDKHCAAFVAINTQQQVIGMCLAQWVISTATGKKSAWVEDMIIHPEYRRKGIGQNLIHVIQKWARLQGCNRMQLAYDIHNQPAIEFYQNLDFNPTQLGIFTKPI